MRLRQLVIILGLSSLSNLAVAQQFAGDNQWVAPYGVGTFVATVGEEYSQFYAIAAMVPEWEFNLQLTHYYDDPRTGSGSYTATGLYVKRRLKENAAGTTGYAFLAGTGLFPEHVEQDRVTNAMKTWWATGVGTYGFFDDKVLLDILPGVAVNLDKETSEDSTWSFTYTSRVAVYDIVPKSTIVAEVFGATGEGYAKPTYRCGLRWESPKWVAALTYSDAFDGSGSAGVEFGIMYFTDPRFCFRGCR